MIQIQFLVDIFLPKTSFFSASSKSSLIMIWWLLSSNTKATPATKINRWSASLVSCYLKATLVLAACLPQLDPDTHTKTVVPLYGLCEAREPKQLCPFLQEKGLQMWKAKDLLAGKRVIYSWPLDSPFQMLDHVKQSINITCAGAFMGPHPFLLIYIPQLTQCCNQSCADDCSSQAANNTCEKGFINIQQTGPVHVCARSFTAAIKLLYILFLNVWKSFDNTT